MATSSIHDSRGMRGKDPHNIDYYQMMTVLQIDILRMIAQRHAQAMTAKAPPVKKGGKEEKGAGKDDKAKCKGPKGGKKGKTDALKVSGN